MVAQKKLSRKALFAAALVQSGTNATAWAAGVGEVSRTQLYRTLDNPAASAPLTAKIDAFIAQHIGSRITAQAS